MKIVYTDDYNAYKTVPELRDEDTRPGLTERQEFEYRHHGTACLFAALDVHSGETSAFPAEHRAP